MGDANSGGPVGEGHGHIQVGEVRVDAAVAPVQATPQGNGVGPLPAVAASDPAIVALRQELLASQQAIAARLTNVENNQAHPQLQQYQQGTKHAVPIPRVLWPRAYRTSRSCGYTGMNVVQNLNGVLFHRTDTVEAGAAPTCF